MEREGYKPGFDAENLEFEASAQEQEEQHARDLYKQRMKKLPMNIIECIVGIALLILCYNYIQTHPAEKSSLFTGMDMLAQKVRVFVGERVGGSGAEIQRKYELEKTFEEIVSLAQQGKCLTQDDQKQIESASEKLKELSEEEFLDQERAYATVAKVYFDKVRKSCGTGDSE